MYSVHHPFGSVFLDLGTCLCGGCGRFDKIRESCNLTFHAGWECTFLHRIVHYVLVVDCLYEFEILFACVSGGWVWGVAESVGCGGR